MLVRLGLASTDSVPEGQRLVRASRSPERPSRALPRPRTGKPRQAPETAYAHQEPSACFDALRAQQVCAAYRAAEPSQPRPGLFIHVQA